jgi:Histidine biosynthesis protein
LLRVPSVQAAENGTLDRTARIPVDSLSLGSSSSSAPSSATTTTTTTLVKRIVVALDVRTNDHGDLVVTKGDQYDVRERNESTISDDSGGDATTTAAATNGTKGSVRNLGKPVALASRYYHEGADEIAFLNITSYRQGVIEDMPMLHVLEEASKNIFVPLTVGGGIRSYTDPATGATWSALEVASRYFRAGADKVRARFVDKRRGDYREGAIWNRIGRSPCPESRSCFLRSRWCLALHR